MFQWVMNTIDGQMSTMMPSLYGSLKQQLWATLDEEISLGDCEVYRYVKDMMR